MTLSCFVKIQVEFLQTQFCVSLKCHLQTTIKPPTQWEMISFGHIYEFVKIKPHYLCYLEAWKYVEASFFNGVLNCPCPNSALNTKVKLTFTNDEAFVEYGISNGGYLRYYLPTIVDLNNGLKVEDVLSSVPSTVRPSMLNPLIESTNASFH